MWIPIRSLDVVSAVVIATPQWRLFHWVFAVVLCCLGVTSLPGDSPDISNMAAYTGKLFYTSFRSHPVYGSLDVSIELSAASADDEFPAWLYFNSSSRSLSGVPLPGDEGVTRLALTSRCVRTSAHRDTYTECHQLPAHAFELTVSGSSWVDSLGSWLPVGEEPAKFSSLEYGVGQAMFAEAGCEGARVVASLVLCSTSEQLTSRDRLDLILHLSDFLAIPVSSITLEVSSASLLTAVKKGFHMVSAGPGLDDVCSLSQNVELLWWLPCSTVKHLGDFVRVLQHNVDGGRLQQELARAIVGWYVASSNSLVTRQSRRRRGATYRTLVPTPALSPLKPTSLVTSAPTDPAVTSSTDLSSAMVQLTADYKIVSPVSSTQVQSEVSPLTVVSTRSRQSSGDHAGTTQLPSLSPSLSPAVVLSSSSLTPTRITSSQLFTQPSWTAQLWYTHHMPTAQFKTGTKFSYSSSIHLGDKHAQQTSRLPPGYVHATSDHLSPIITQDNRASSTFPNTVTQSPTDRAISTVSTETPHDTANLDLLQPASSEADEYGLLIADSDRLSALLLHPSSTCVDWQQKPGPETSTSFIQDVSLFGDIQTKPTPQEKSFPEPSTTQEVRFQQPQMSEHLTLLTPSSTLSSASAYLVISRDVQVIPPLFTSTESLFAEDAWAGLLPSTPDSTSVSVDTVPYLTDSDWHGKYNTSPDIDTVWNTAIYKYPDIQILPTKQGLDEQPQEGDKSHSQRSFLVPQLSELLHSAHNQTASQHGDMFPEHSFYTPHGSVSTLDIAADWALIRKSSKLEASSVKAELEVPELAVVTSSSSTVDDSSQSFIALSVSLSQIAASTYASVHVDKISQSTVAVDVARSSVEASRWDTTGSPTNTTVATLRLGATSSPTNTTSVATPRMDATGSPTNTTSVATPSVSFLFFTSAATKRPRIRTTTPAVARARTKMTTTSTTITTTTTTTAATTQRATTSKRPAARKASTHRVRTTTQRTTPGWDDEDALYPDHFNNRPYVQRPINVLRADQGKLLEFMVPHDVFYDIEDGDTRHLSLSLELPSNQVLPDNFWLYIEPTQQVIKALPLHEDMDVKNMSVALVARDKQGLAAADYITLQINDTPRRSFTHVFRMKFAVGFLQFMHSRRNITELLERIGNFFGDSRARWMTVLEVRQGSFIMSWTNHSLTGATCQTDTIKHLYSLMVRKDGSVRQAFSRQIGRHLHLREVQMQPWGSCLAAPATTTTTSTSTSSTSTHLMSEVKGHGFSVWAHVLLPVLIAVLAFILIILIIIFCNRRRRQRQTTLSGEKEAISNDGNPVIFPSECEAEDPSSKARDPRVSPTADLQPNQNTSAGSSLVKNNLNRDQERAKRGRDNREQEWLNKDTQIHDPESEMDWSRNFHRKHTKDSSSGRRHRDPDRTSRVSASSTLSWDRPNNHYLEEEAGSRSSTLKSTKSAGSDKRHRRSPPPYWQHQTDPPPYRMPPPYLSNNAPQM